MTSSNQLTGKCHCGAVRVTIPTKPEFTLDCNCSLCSSHGALWGYFDPANVSVTGETQTYARADRPNPAVNIHFCPVCGCTTHFALTGAFVETHGKNDQMGTNMRIFPPEAMRGVEIRFPDGLNWDWTGNMPFRRPSEIG